MPLSVHNHNHNHSHSQHHKHVKNKGGLINSIQKTVIYGGALFILMNFLVVVRMSLSSTIPGTKISSSGANSGENGHHQSGAGTVRKMKHHPFKKTDSKVQCHFRQYPPRRYYGLHKLDQPEFLVGDTVDYIYGKYPILLTPSNHPAEMDFDSTQQGKLCVDQSAWLSPEQNDRKKQLPFADGTNPSILSLDRLQPEYSSLYKQFTQDLGGRFIATLCMTDSQCSYKDSKEEIQQYKLSTHEKATVIQTELLLLDEQFQTLLQTTIYLERDAPWGRKYKAQHNKDETAYKLQAFALDDARLFVHRNRLWVSYREGPSFGYEQQVLNEIHLEYNNAKNTKTLSAIIKASESISFCCGRNMALMEALIDNDQKDNQFQLQSLTWADPVTVIDVDTTPQTQNEQPQTKTRRRQLAETHKKKKKKKKSHFHGTNQFMIYLPRTHEFLGIGHYHRPHGRDAFNPYARFGHHYTHTFYTISSRPPYRLTRLSREFVLPSKNPMHADDADIIQFLSGLDVISDHKNNNKEWAVIAYGINDCEGAALYLELERIEQLLQEVPEGKEVVDLMYPLVPSELPGAVVAGAGKKKRL